MSKINAVLGFLLGSPKYGKMSAQKNWNRVYKTVINDCVKITGKTSDGNVYATIVEHPPTDTLKGKTLDFIRKAGKKVISGTIHCEKDINGEKIVTQNVTHHFLEDNRVKMGITKMRAKGNELLSVQHSTNKGKIVFAEKAEGRRDIDGNIEYNIRVKDESGCTVCILPYSKESWKTFFTNITERFH